jgi:hypothetical protein
MAVADAFGFEPQVVVPERPSSVPISAAWAGGSDGGAWIECSVDPEKNANWCTVWNDQTGDVWARTLFVDRAAGEAVPGSALQYSSFNGLLIDLSDGRVLEPEVFRSRERDPWAGAAIDSPRLEERGTESGVSLRPEQPGVE